MMTHRPAMRTTDSAGAPAWKATARQRVRRVRDARSSKRAHTDASASRRPDMAGTPPSAAGPVNGARQRSSTPAASALCASAGAPAWQAERSECLAVPHRVPPLALLEAPVRDGAGSGARVWWSVPKEQRDPGQHHTAALRVSQLRAAAQPLSRAAGATSAAWALQQRATALRLPARHAPRAARQRSHGSQSAGHEPRWRCWMPLAARLQRALPLQRRRRSAAGGSMQRACCAVPLAR
jgi:hypothetical protein